MTSKLAVTSKKSGNRSRPVALAGVWMLISIAALIATFMYPGHRLSVVGTSLAAGVLGAAARALALLLTDPEQASGSAEKQVEDARELGTARWSESLAALPMGAAFGTLTFVLASAIASFEALNIAVLTLYAFVTGFFSASLLGVLVRNGSLLLRQNVRESDPYDALLGAVGNAALPYFQRPTNYDGYVSARITIARPEEPLTHNVFVQFATRTPETKNARVLLTGGEDHPAAVFTVALRAANATVLPSEVTMKVPTDGPSEEAHFKVDVEERSDGGDTPDGPTSSEQSFLVVVTHLGKTVQILEVRSQSSEA